MNKATLLIDNIFNLLEARSHPELNKKLPPEEEIKLVLSKHYEMDLNSDLPLYFISFRDEHNKDMLTMNIYNEYSTPTGVYAYPIRYAYKKGKIDVPFASDYPYIYLLKRKSENVLFTKKYSKQKYNEDSKRLKVYFIKNYGDEYSLLDEDAEYYADQLSQANNRQTSNVDKMWCMSQLVAKKLAQGSETSKWNLILSKVLGYDVVIDMGMGVVHPNEPNQAIFFNRGTYEVIDKINNVPKEIPNSIEIKGVDYNLKNLRINKEKLVINDSLNLRGGIINKFPTDFMITGDLNLSKAVINDITNLKVKGDLVFSNAIFNKLPNSLEVGGSLYFCMSNLNKLPDNLNVKGKIDISNTKITELPDNLVVNDDFDISNTNIKKLPENLTVKGLLDIAFTGITELPASLRVGAITLENTNITTLPEGFVFNGNMSISDTKLTDLPDNLTIKGNLFMEQLNSPNYIELPDNLTVMGDLNLMFSKITKLPENLKVGGDLWMINQKITELPNSFQVKGEVKVDSNNTSLKIPNNLKKKVKYY